MWYQAKQCERDCENGLNSESLGVKIWYFIIVSQTEQYSKNISNCVSVEKPRVNSVTKAPKNNMVLLKTITISAFVASSKINRRQYINNYKIDIWLSVRRSTLKDTKKK